MLPTQFSFPISKSCIDDSTMISCSKTNSRLDISTPWRWFSSRAYAFSRPEMFSAIVGLSITFTILVAVIRLERSASTKSGLSLIRRLPTPLTLQSRIAAIDVFDIWMTFAVKLATLLVERSRRANLGSPYR